MSKKNNLIKNSTQVCKTPTSSKLFSRIWPFLLLIVVFIAGCSKENQNPTTDNSFTSSKALGTVGLAVSPAPINLRTAGNFTILTSTGISTTGVTTIIGDIGTSPIASTAITGFGLIKDASNQFS
ncbi:ice-binding family protein, partial [Mucilaginibacter sp.]|uniref:ice-binding family protein n=1 Tax=Mucilaginibacter sp. TaxID=1882438 RepID=UPI002A1A1692|nr:flagellar hook-length control protein FliK [Mucilaginibacter sp.]